MNVAWIVAVVQLAQLPGAMQHPYDAANPACRDEVTAAPICDEAFRLFETGVRVEAERDTCKIDLRASEAKLQNHLVPPPPTIVTVSEIPTWAIVVFTGAVALAFIGGAYTALRLHGSP